MRHVPTMAAAGRLFFTLILAAAVAATASQVARAQSEEDLVADAKAASASIVEQHVLAQQGLSIGLGAGFVQGQMALLGASPTLNKCFTVSGGGGIKMLKLTHAGNKAEATIELYYDAACKHRYLNAVVDLTQVRSDLLSMSETATLYGSTGKTLGKLKLKGTVTFFSGKSNNVDAMSATGTFTPTGLAAVDVGFDCGLPSFGGAATVPCHVGVAQTSSAVGGDIASVTPVTVKLKASNQATFTANNAELARGASGKLGITAPNNHSLKITGTHTAVGKASGTGTLAVFSVFPKGPSSWVSTDTANNARFSIAMAKGSDTLKGTIKKLSTGATLATFSVDRSGTGSIVYSDKTKVAITSWIVAK